MKSFYPFRKALLILICFSFVTHLFSQQTEFNYGNRWRLGLNMGGMWLASDMKNYAGFAGGLTIEKGLTKSKTAPLYFDLRYRYLAGKAFGLDSRVNRNIQNNEALNGSKDSVSNYAASPGYFFNNFRTRISQHDLELKVGFNQLLQRSRIHLYVWGGIGITKYTTQLDTKDALGNKYNFAGVDTSSAVNTISDLTSLYDNSYETYGTGMTAAGVTRIAPSFGIGFGYKFSDHFSLIFEHKVTFPGVDNMDGEKNFQKKNTFSNKNDYFHYSGAKLLFTFGRSRSNTNTYSNPDNYTSNPTNTRPPDVTIISPSSNPYTSPANNVQVYANVKNVSDASQIIVRVNGNQVTNFNFTVGSGAVSFSTLLNPGSNTISVSANNNYGSDSETIVVNYNVLPQGMPPIVNIYTPINNSSVQNSPIQVSANISNVNSMNQVNVSVNGMQINNYSFNAANGDISFTTPLNTGNNSITISGSNQFGNDNKTVFVNMSSTFVPSAVRPVITITNPPFNGYTSTSSAFNFTATVLNVVAASQISVQVNGNFVNNFTYNPSSLVLSIPATLNSGSNTLVVTATNQAGSDTKSTTVLFNDITPSGNPPVVSFTNPVNSPYTLLNPSMTINAIVTNVSSTSGIKLYVNNVADNNFSFNGNTQTLTYNLNMGAAAASVITVVGTNQFGSDTKSVTILKGVQADPLPVVTITNPANAPYTAQNTAFTVLATALNVNNNNQITVNVNGNNTSNFTFNATTHQVSVPLNLNAGSTVVTITATNNSGSASASTTLLYTAPVLRPVVTYVSPLSNPHTSSTQTCNVVAMVTNITAQNQVSVTVNGNSTPFTWNQLNYQASFSAALNPGNNTVVVTGTNAGGSDSKTLTIVYSSKAVSKPIVNITTPASAGTTVNTPAYVFTAQVLNVQNAGQITVQFNGANVPFQFAMGSVTYSANLINGNNTFSVAATTGAGSDQANTTIIYQPPVITPPLVQITTPAAAGTTVSTPAYVFTALVTGVTSSSNISVNFNGAAVPFQYNNGTVNFSANLLQGNNTLQVSASNAGGNDSKSTSIIYQPAVVTPAPVVTITSPASAGTSVSVPTYTFSATVSNVTSANNVSVQFNGTNVNAQFSNGIVTYATTLNAGNNTFAVSASNAGGNDSKSTSIIFQPFVATPVPVVTITSPASAGTTVSVATYTFTATVSNVTSANNVSVQFNGANVNAQFSHGTVTYAAMLNSGSNTFAVSASNAGGNDSKSTNINYQAPTPPPTIVFINPPVAGTNTGTSAFIFKAIITGAGGANQLIVKYNAQVISGFTFNSSSGSFNYIGSLNQGSNTLEITATNAGGSDNKSTSVYYIPAQPDTFQSNPTLPGGATGGGQGSQGGSNNDPLITICHIPPGNPNNPQTITINQSAWPAHQAHGDVMGACAPGNNANQGGQSSGQGSQSGQSSGQGSQSGQSSGQGSQSGQSSGQGSQSGQSSGQGNQGGQVITPGGGKGNKGGGGMNIGNIIGTPGGNNGGVQQNKGNTQQGQQIKPTTPSNTVTPTNTVTPPTNTTTPSSTITPKEGAIQIKKPGVGK